MNMTSFINKYVNKNANISLGTLVPTSLYKKDDPRYLIDIETHTNIKVKIASSPDFNKNIQNQEIFI